MIPVSRLAVFIIIAALGLIAAPMVFANQASPFDNLQVWAPIVVAVEIGLYFLLTLFTNSRMTIGAVFGLSIALVIFRCVGSMIGFSLQHILLSDQSGTGPAALQFWIGNPIAVAVQVVTLILVTPHVLEALTPDMVDKEFRNKLSGSATPVQTATSHHTVDSNPQGGFIQVFSFEELAAVVRKAPGLEGFLIFSQEGLIVWRDLPMRVEVDEIAARLMSKSDQIGNTMGAAGLSKMRRLMIESREHLIFITALNQNFGLILLFNGRTKMSDCEGRIGILAKTAREFLQWKYPGLSVVGSLASQSAAEAR